MQKNNVKKMALVAIFAALMVIGAYLKIPNPFFPVFFTFQGVFCAFAGLLLGPNLGAAAIGLYILMGLAGLPVFSAPSGPQYIFHPTFGFLLGFLAAAWIIGKISNTKSDFTPLKAFVASFSGLMAIYVLGIGYMYLINYFYNKSPVGLWALVSGMSLYLLKDLILFFVVAILSVQIKKRIPKLI